MFRKSKNARRHLATLLRMEQLENRQLCAGDLVAGLDTHGNLNIVGSSYEDVVTVKQIGNQIKVSTETTGIGDPLKREFSFNAGQIVDIRFWGNGRDDAFRNDTNKTSHAWGGDGNDTLIGGSSLDWLYGEDGNDDLSGRDGADRLDAGAGDWNRLSGGKGNDQLFASWGVNHMYGDEGDDLMRGGGLFDYMDGGADNDTMYGGFGNDEMYGMSGNDLIFGEEGMDFIHGGSGHDTMHAGSGGAVMYGDSGIDTAFGGSGSDGSDAELQFGVEHDYRKKK